jgi:hypothetical protein
MTKMIGRQGNTSFRDDEETQRSYGYHRNLLPSPGAAAKAMLLRK